MKTKTIYHLNHDCDKIVKIEVIVKSKKNKKRPVEKTERYNQPLKVEPEKICELYNKIAKTLGFRFVDASDFRIKRQNNDPLISYKWTGFSVDS